MAGKPSIFDSLNQAITARGIDQKSGQARKWFEGQVTGISATTVMSDSALIEKSRPQSGRMYHFVYNPKLRDALPYYDRFPLILMVGPGPKGFYGLNLHYLNPLLRAKFLDKLLELASTKQLDENTKIAFSYSMLKTAAKYREFAPCFKLYLFEHVTTKLAMIPAEFWGIAAFLPTQKFKGSTSEKIWADSRSIARL